MLDPSEVEKGFGEGVNVFTNKDELRKFIESEYTGHENLLLMSSRTFDGMHIEF